MPIDALLDSCCCCWPSSVACRKLFVLAFGPWEWEENLKIWLFSLILFRIFCVLSKIGIRITSLSYRASYVQQMDISSSVHMQTFPWRLKCESVHSSQHLVSPKPSVQSRFENLWCQRRYSFQREASECLSRRFFYDFSHIFFIHFKLIHMEVNRMQITMKLLSLEDFSRRHSGENWNNQKKKARALVVSILQQTIEKLSRNIEKHFTPLTIVFFVHHHVSTLRKHFEILFHEK